MAAVKLTEYEGLFGRFAAQADVLLHQNVKANVLGQQEALHVGVHDGVFPACIARQQQDVLRGAGAERIVCGEADGHHRVVVVSRIHRPLVESKQHLVARVHQLAVDRVTVHAIEHSRASVADDTVVDALQT